jgi:hypothetical protein
MRRALTAVALAALGVLTLAPPASAQLDDGWPWIIEEFNTTITVGADDGLVHVEESIAVDFRDREKHGIFRVIPVRYDLSPSDNRVDLPEGRDASEFYRVIEIDNIEVHGTAPTDTVIEEPSRFEGRNLSIRIGDEDRTVSGPQSYTITYDVHGALNSFEDHGELYWNATGDQWEVPIRRSQVTLRAPSIRDGVCFRGPVGATSVCDRSQVRKSVATFGADNLQPGEGLTFATSFPPEAVTVPPPILVEKWDPAKAFSGSPAAVPAALGLTVLGIVAISLLAFRQGRDRVTRGGVAVDGSVGAHPEERRGLFAPRVTPVEFHPPDNLRPGQLGVLVDERVDPVDISATIVDLAVRGHLRITEIEEQGLFRTKKDWQLDQLESEDPLLPFEQRLLTGLFEDGAQVKIKALKGTFATHYKAAQSLLYQDAKDQGWFPSRPDSTRTAWLALGIVGLIFSGGAFVAAMAFTTWAVAMLPLVVLAMLLIILHRWMPHRTGKGSRTLDKALGFREFIVNAEAGRAEYAENQNLFIPYLPYAVVFGAVEKWAGTFAALNTEPATMGMGLWYVGAHPGAFDAGGFSEGISDFSSAVGTTLPTAPASSGGSGFGGSSGGGFGGGGGGSW